MNNSRLTRKPVDLAKYQPPATDFAHLSLRDLIDARDAYHQHLLTYPNVVATALGPYRIRHGDSWPNEKRKRHGKGVRTLGNSEVRPYSWPCVIVFVNKWEDLESFAHRPSEMVPTTLFMPDGRKVPVCVVEAPRESATEVAAPTIEFPTNNMGPGQPLVARVQGQSFVATVTCLVSDGHKYYALANRHVTGAAGEEVYARVGGSETRIGESAGMELTRMRFADLYPSFVGRDTFVNLDIGLIELDDLSSWTTKVRGIGVVGPMADFSDRNISLSLVGCRVRGVGAATGEMLGEIQALFYRYKTSGGFEYVADLMIGPRTAVGTEKPRPGFQTLPGDSGTLWLLEPKQGEGKDANGKAKKAPDSREYLPLAVEWGRNVLHSAGKAEPQGYALATLLSRACALLNVDVVRDWNLDQPDTWGALGHFSIAARSKIALSSRHRSLSRLMYNNADIISRSEADLAAGEFKGMGSADFVPMADVPDFFWKPRVAKQGHSRSDEGPNHFADMDQKNPDGKTLLDLTTDDAFINPDKWQTFYDSVTDLLSGKAITPQHRGLLPFRVWQIFDEIVRFVALGKAPEFVCAAGVLTHYLGDACQPLHISYLHDGDPLRPTTHTFSKGKKAGQSEKRALGQGVHSAYEDDMVFANRGKILDGLQSTPKVQADEVISTGFDAARRTIGLMRDTFKLIPPTDIVEAFVQVGSSGKAASAALWKQFGTKTIAAMQNGAHLVAVLWESAWEVGNGDATIKSAEALTQDQAMKIVADPGFLPSMTIDRIGAVLKGRAQGGAKRMSTAKAA